MAFKYASTAGELMTSDVVTLTEDQSLEHLEGAMRALKFRHMPVVDGDRLVGLVTLRDVYRVSASTLLPSKPAQDRFLSEHFRVRDVMSRDVISVQPDTSLIDLAKLMTNKKLGCVPIVGADNRLLGIVTEADFVRLGLHLLEHLQRVGG